jgi:putative addiction module component (TIGR02574 family)
MKYEGYGDGLRVSVGSENEIELLIDALAGQHLDEDRGQLELTQAQKQELERRIADMEANPDEVIPWEQVYADAMKRLRK